MKTLDEEWKKKFIVNKNNKDFVLYAGLIDLATEMGLSGIETRLIQIDSDENNRVAVVTAVASRTIDGITMHYSGIGDASPRSVAPALQNCLPRFAETRAIARALRLLTNIGMTALEELEPEETTTQAQSSRPARAASATNAKDQSKIAAAEQKREKEEKAAAVASAEHGEKSASETEGEMATEKQVAIINRKLKERGSKDSYVTMTRKQYISVAQTLI